MHFRHSERRTVSAAAVTIQLNGIAIEAQQETAYCKANVLTQSRN